MALGDGIIIPINLLKSDKLNWDAIFIRDNNLIDSLILYNELAVVSVEIIINITSKKCYFD